MSLKIETITAFVATDKEGNEGIMGFKSTDAWMPMVCADEERIKSILPMAIKISEMSGQPFRVIKFTNRKDITEQLNIES